MYATLHEAFGTWPTESDRAFTISSASKDVRPSALNETFDFEDNSTEPGQPVFTFKPQDQPNGRTFIPPFFVPPGPIQNGGSSRPAASSSPVNLHSHRSNGIDPLERQRTYQANDTGPPFHQNALTGPPLPKEPSQVQNVEALVDTQRVAPQPQDAIPRPPSPASTPTIDAERAELWSPEARKAFHEMVTGPGYINRYRLHMKKRERMMQFLQNPDKEPLLCDGSRDHQTKYQAAHWTVIDGKLYRKHEGGRVARYRRHLDDFEAWDVLTTEHVRSGHLGRDKLRKVLEQNYIGYTLQEIMFVLKECKKCAGRGGNGERKDSENDVRMSDAAETEDAVDVSAVQTGTEQSMRSPTPREGPYGRQQTSNFMWF